MGGNIVELVRIVKNTRISLEGIYLIDATHHKKIAKMISGRLKAGESIYRVVPETINFYSSHHKAVNENHPEVDQLIKAIKRWQLGDQAPPAKVPIQATAEEVETIVQEFFENQYGTEFGENWRQIDTNDFDLDPVHFLEGLAQHFQIDLPPYGTNQSIINFIKGELGLS